MNPEVQELIDAAIAVADIYTEAQTHEGPVPDTVLSLSIDRHKRLLYAVDRYRKVTP